MLLLYNNKKKLWEIIGTLTQNIKMWLKQAVYCDFRFGTKWTQISTKTGTIGTKGGFMQGSVRKRGATWSYYFDLGKVGGRRKKREKGGYRTKKEAETALRQAIAEYERGGVVMDPAEITLSDYLDEWLSAIEPGVKYNTVKAYRSIIDGKLKPAMGSYKIRSLSTAAIQQQLNAWSKKFSKAYLHLIYVVIKSSLDYAVEPMHYIPVNPCNGAKVPRYAGTREPGHAYIAPEDFEQIYSYYKERGEKSEGLLTAVMIGYHTGMRMSEVCGLTWDHVDMQKRLITVDRQILYKDHVGHYFDLTKRTASDRVIMIGGTLYDYLVDLEQKHKERLETNTYHGYHEENGFVVRGGSDLYFVCCKRNGRRVTKTAATPNFRACSLSLGLKWDFHALRHSHATNLAKTGMSPKLIQDRMGHSSVTLTYDLYVHVTDEMRQNGMELYEKSLNGGKSVANDENDPEN